MMFKSDKQPSKDLIFAWKKELMEEANRNLRRARNRLEGSCRFSTAGSDQGHRTCEPTRELFSRSALAHGSVNLSMMQEPDANAWRLMSPHYSSLLKLLLTYFFIVTIFAPETLAQYDDFESPDCKWKLLSSDCHARLARAETQFTEAHAGDGCQHIALLCGQGSRAYVGYPLPKSVIIDELMPSLWLKSDHAGLQLLARVVLPRSPHPNTGEPLSVLVPGKIYRKPGEWQQLDIDDFTRGLQQQVRILRSQYETDINPEDAFLDRLVLNAFGGPGVTKIWIDDLRVDGLVPRDALKGIVGKADAKIATVSFDAALDAPRFIRAIQHNGEPFAWLKERGFNTVVLSLPASQSQLQQARRDSVFLIAPPPNLETANITQNHNVVIQWRLPPDMLLDFPATKALLAPGCSHHCSVAGNHVDHE